MEEVHPLPHFLCVNEVVNNELLPSCHAFPSMMDAIPLEMEVKTNPFFFQLPLAGISSNSNTRVTNTVLQLHSLVKKQTGI